MIGTFRFTTPDVLKGGQYVQKAKEKLLVKLMSNESRLDVSLVKNNESPKHINSFNLPCKKNHKGIVQESKSKKSKERILHVAIKVLTVLSNDLKNTDWLPATLTGVLRKILYYSRFIGILSEVYAQWTRIKHHYKGTWFKDFDIF